MTNLTVASLLALCGTHALALSLGKLSVLSALGEPLKAEIDIPSINAEEAASLKTQIAPPDMFKAVGLVYNPVMTELQLTLQKRPDGRTYLRLNSDKSVNEPFIDLILEVSWNSGRIMRDYTMLFDPPHLQPTNSLSPTPPQLPAPEKPDTPEQTVPVLPPEPDKSTVQGEIAPVTPPSDPGIASKPKTAPTAPTAQDARQVSVAAGDTAGKIAVNNKPANVSLDQMLVALVRRNPDAFIRNNINRIKAGAILNLPPNELINATTPEQARVIVAQSRNFNDFRNKLASNVPAAQTVAVDRKIRGQVQATVEDKKPISATPDKLTLSKGAVAGTSKEDKLAADRSASQAANRATEIAKNISDLNKLVSASTPAASAASIPKNGLPVVPVPRSSAPVPPASVQQPSPAASLPASAPVKSPSPEKGFWKDIMDNPILPLGVAGLLALLAVFGIHKVRQRKKTAPNDGSYLENRLNPDSFFGSTGGQNIDTNLAAGSSVGYFPSQLDDVDDVDPVAEADVYLAYGRDIQAEEILKDALRSFPDRLAVHQKLLEIYAKRSDAAAFESIAALAYVLTHGTGQDWAKICESGLALDPENSLYLPGGQPVAGRVAPAPEPPEQTDLPTAFSTLGSAAALAPKPHPTEASVDLDLDLDFSLDEPNMAPTASSAPEQDSHDTQDVPLPDLKLNFDTPTPAPTPGPIPEPTPEPEPEKPTEPDLGALDFDMSDFVPASKAAESPVAPPIDPAQLGMLEFDLGSLSLDLGGDEAVTTHGELDKSAEDPLATKLALAEEFKAIGDNDGARALIEEVIAEAAGDIRAKAQSALDKL